MLVKSWKCSYEKTSSDRAVHFTVLPISDICFVLI